MYQSLAIGGAFKALGHDDVGFSNVAAAGEKPSLPQSMFKGTDGTSSVPKSELDRVTGKADYPSFCARSKEIIPCASQVLILLNEADAWGTANVLWQALLIQCGDIIRKQASTYFLYVEDVKEFGILITQAKCVKCSDPKRACVTTDPADMGTWITITDYKAWLVYPLHGSAPINRLGIDEYTIHIWIDRKGIEVAERAAYTGFKGMTNMFVQKLLSTFDLTKLDVQPKTAIDKLMVLLKTILLGLSEVEYHSISLKRFPKTAMLPICASTSVGADVMDESDLREVHKQAAAHEDSKATQTNFAEMLNPGSKYLEDVKAVSGG